MSMRRYRNGSHQVRGNARRPFRHARRIQKLANSATIHYSLLPVRCPDDTATVYYNYRHYEPVTGRWMQRDPIEEKGGLNLLNFVCNSSLEKTDGFGLSFFDYVPFIGLIRAIVDDLIGSIPGESVVDYPFASPYDCKCNVESAEAKCQAKVNEKMLEFAAGQTISAVVSAAVSVASTALTVKFPNWVTAILAVEELVSGAVKAHLLSKVMRGYRMAMANNCKCDQYERK